MHPLLRVPYALAAGFASAVVHVPVHGNGKLARALEARRGVTARARAWAATARDRSRPLLWIHAPSVGEGLQARPVIEQLRRSHPDWQLAYSWYSPSAEAFAASLGADFTFCLPFDTARAARGLLDALVPDALVFAKLDLWPVLAAEAQQRRVPLGMISATLSATSGRTGMMARALLGDAYASLDAVGAIDASDADRLARLGVRSDRVRVTGDTRFDQVVARAAAADRAAPPLANFRRVRPTLVAGSTWPTDEAVLLPAWERLVRAVPDARLIIAPHEPTAAHLAPIERWASRAGLTSARLGSASGDTGVVIVDRVGVLGELYALADVAFVGGGFHRAGLHSVLEPAAFAAPVLFGPRHQGSRDAGLLIAGRGGASVSGRVDLIQRLELWFSDPAARKSSGSAARAVVEKGLGAAARSAALVEELVLNRK